MLMVSVKVKADLKQIKRFLSKLEKRQIPFATALALTLTAKQAQKAEKKQIVQKLDRPKPFTVKSIFMSRATKKRPVSSVYIRPAAWEYLRWQVEGGTRKPNGRFIPIPVGAKLDQYGNIKGRKRGPRTKKQFITKVNNTIGVYENIIASRKRLLIYYARQAVYKPKFPFFKIARKVGQSVFHKNFNKSMIKAINTAKK